MAVDGEQQDSPLQPAGLTQLYKTSERQHLIAVGVDGKHPCGCLTVLTGLITWSPRACVRRACLLC